MKNFKDITVAVAGTGYVGLSIATLLTQHHHVTSVDVIPEKAEKLNNKISQNSKFLIGIVERRIFVPTSAEPNLFELCRVQPKITYV